MTRRFIDSLQAYTPVWLRNRPTFKAGWSLLWLTSLMCDQATQAALEGLRAGFPGRDSRVDNLALLGASRGLVQGEAETGSAFAARLIKWLTTYKDCGGDVGLAMQLHLYLSNNPQVRIWNRWGRCTTVNQDGSISQVTVTPLDWDSISNPERNSVLLGGRPSVQGSKDIWITVYPDNAAYRGLYGSGVVYGSDLNGWGHQVTPSRRDTVRSLVRRWKGADTVVRLIVWTTNAALFDPANLSEAGNPNGRWGLWSFYGTRPSDSPGPGTNTGWWPARRRVDCRYWVTPTADAPDASRN